MPGLGVLELAAVVYHSGGKSYESGHYTCAARAPDRMFWYFDDAATPRRLGENIADFKSECVAVLAYVRPGGEAKYASGPVDVADSDAGSDSGRTGCSVCVSIRGPSDHLIRSGYMRE